MSYQEESVIEMALEGIEVDEPGPEGFTPARVVTSRGPVECRYYAVPEPMSGVITVGGAGGGWDTPVRGWLYPRLCRDLSRIGVSCLRVKYRRPNDLLECTLDVLAGIAFLESEGVERIGLVGHSFGGAVVIQAAAFSPNVVAIAPLSTQSYGADAAADLSPRCSILLMHGTQDEILPLACSERVFEMAGEPKRFVPLPGARHGLDEADEQVFSTVKAWLVQYLGGSSQDTTSQRASLQ